MERRRGKEPEKSPKPYLFGAILDPQAEEAKSKVVETDSSSKRDGNVILIDTNLLVGPLYVPQTSHADRLKDKLEDITEQLAKTLYTLEELDDLEPHEDPTMAMMKQQIESTPDPNIKNQLQCFIQQYEGLMTQVSQRTLERDEILLQLADESINMSMDEAEEEGIKDSYIETIKNFEKLKLVHERIENAKRFGKTLKNLERQKLELEKNVVENLKIVKEVNLQAKQTVLEEDPCKFAAKEIVDMLQNARFESTEGIAALKNKTNELLKEIEKQSHIIKSVVLELKEKKEVVKKITEENGDLVNDLANLQKRTKRYEKDLHTAREFLSKINSTKKDDGISSDAQAGNGGRKGKNTEKDRTANTQDKHTKKDMAGQPTDRESWLAQLPSAKILPKDGKPLIVTKTGNKIYRITSDADLPLTESISRAFSQVPGSDSFVEQDGNDQQLGGNATANNLSLKAKEDQKALECINAECTVAKKNVELLTIDLEQTKQTLAKFAEEKLVFLQQIKKLQRETNKPINSPGAGDANICAYCKRNVARGNTEYEDELTVLKAEVDKWQEKCHFYVKQLEDSEINLKNAGKEQISTDAAKKTADASGKGAGNSDAVIQMGINNAGNIGSKDASGKMETKNAAGKMSSNDAGGKIGTSHKVAGKMGTNNASSKIETNIASGKMGSNDAGGKMGTKHAAGKMLGTHTAATGKTGTNDVTTTIGTDHDARSSSSKELNKTIEKSAQQFEDAPTVNTGATNALQHPYSPEISENLDTSMTCLMGTKSSKMFLLKNGADCKSKLFQSNQSERIAFEECMTFEEFIEQNFPNLTKQQSRELKLYKVGDLQGKLNLLKAEIMDFMTEISKTFHRDKENEGSKIQLLKSANIDGLTGKSLKDIISLKEDQEKRRGQLMIIGQQACLKLNEAFDMISYSLNMQHEEYEALYRSYKISQQRNAIRFDIFMGRLPVDALIEYDIMQKEKDLKKYGKTSLLQAYFNLTYGPIDLNSMLEIRKLFDEETEAKLKCAMGSQYNVIGQDTYLGIKGVSSFMGVEKTQLNFMDMLASSPSKFVCNLPRALSTTMSCKLEMKVSHATVPAKGLIQLSTEDQEMLVPVEKKPSRQPSKLQNSNSLIKRKDLIEQVKVGTKLMMDSEEQKQKEQAFDNSLGDYTVLDFQSKILEMTPIITDAKSVRKLNLSQEAIPATLGPQSPGPAMLRAATPVSVVIGAVTPGPVLLGTVTPGPTVSGSAKKAPPSDITGKKQVRPLALPTIKK